MKNNKDDFEIPDSIVSLSKQCVNFFFFKKVAFTELFPVCSMCWRLIILNIRATQQLNNAASYSTWVP